MPSPFLFIEEIAEETRTPPSTVRHWIATGKLASVRPGRRRLVRRSDLDAFLANAPSPSKADAARCLRAAEGCDSAAPVIDTRAAGEKP
jgi:excisionase family DNA binding protein